MTIVLADYRSMCDLIGPLDVEVFCAGYACFEEWKAAPNRRADVAACELRRGELPGSASYAA
ncbi:MAG: hypothetical protein AABO58_11010 [Acidobacteriota bacterium]